MSGFKILRSISLDEAAKTLKSLMSTLVEHNSEWSRTAECGLLVRGTPDRKLTPACSATLVPRVRVVMPTCSDVNAYNNICTPRKTVNAK